MKILILEVENLKEKLHFLLQMISSTSSLSIVLNLWIALYTDHNTRPDPICVT